MTRTGPIGSKPLQGKKLHGKKMDWDQKMGSKQKTWHRLGKKWEANNCSEKLASDKHGLGRNNGKQKKQKKWHLRKRNRTETGKETTPSEKLASYKNGLRTKNGKQKDTKKNGTLEKGIGRNKWEANSSR